MSGRTEGGNVERRPAFFFLLVVALGLLLPAVPAFAQTANAPNPANRTDAATPPDRHCSDREIAAGVKGCEPKAGPQGGGGFVILPEILVDLFPWTESAPPQVSDGGGTAPASADNGAPASGDGSSGGPPPQGALAAVPPANLPPVTPPQAISGAFVPDEVLVTLQGDGAVAQDVAAAFGLDVRSQRVSTLLGSTIVRYGIPDGRPVGVVLAQLAADPRAVSRVPNHVYDLQQAGTVNYAFKRITLDAGAATGADVKVAVIDTAVDEKHPALADAIAETFDAMPGEAIVSRDHGTSVAGLIAGKDPLRGMAPGATIYHARAFESGKSTMNIILEAFDWAANKQARIVNMSFVGPKNEMLEAACANARARGMILVAAAGNNGPGAPYGYPAAYKGVIAVTATDQADGLMQQANRGPYVFVSAPGVDMVAPIGGGSDLVTGTSFAAAIVSGAIANLLHEAPDRSADWVTKALAETAIDLGKKGRDSDFGHGLLNFKAAREISR